MDVVVAGPDNPDFVNNISPNPLDTFHASPFRSLPSPPPKNRNMLPADYHDMLVGNVFDCLESPCTFRGYDPSLDHCTLYLETMPVKIMMTSAFNHSKDLSRAFDKFWRTLTNISRFMFKCCYSHSSELHAQVFDKLT